MSSDGNIVRSLADARDAVAAARDAGRRIALVPTMGALHEGHLALADAARLGGAYVVMSVFVNPLQFSPGEDFERYPRDLAADAAMAVEREVDLIFAPATAEMYSGELEVTVRAGRLASDWEGRIRPGHFDGMLTVVAKLFNIVQPDVAWFGQKDLQQSLLVRAMVRDLNIPVELGVVPTVRDADGLALSSRNRYLSKDERTRALALSGALNAVKTAYDRGERDVEELEHRGHAKLLATPGIKIDYMAVVELQTFRRPAVLTEPGAAVGAIRVGSTRLIDNVLLGLSTL
jgi:pantoate--beta-alanine ligase